MKSRTFEGIFMSEGKKRSSLVVSVLIAIVTQPKGAQKYIKISNKAECLCQKMYEYGESTVRVR